MHTSFRTLKTLSGLGLTEYQARAYTALLTPKVATAEEVSRSSGVPRSKVYQVLLELQEQGWISIEKGRPLRFRPKDPRGVIAKKMDNFTKELDATKGELVELYQKEGVEEEVPARVLQGMRIVLERELDAIQGAQSEIVLEGALYFPEELEAIIPRLFRAHEKGIAIKVVAKARVTVDGRSVDVMQAFESIECQKEFKEIQLMKKLLVDDRVCILTFGDTNKRGIDSSTIAGISTRKKEVIEGFLGKN
jgi:sugar-specific transcriptional regulator TrmB